MDSLTNEDYFGATDILNRRIKSEPNNYEHYFERSICHHQLGDYQASLEDANTAITLNPADYGIHYQKGLALTGLKMFYDAVVSFKKAIELRAKQEDSKLSDIFKLLRDAINEINTARKPGRGAETVPLPSNQPKDASQLSQDITSNITISNNNGNSNNDPPSSSMPDTPVQGSSTTSASKDNSYSSKYKRLRRDRERARRGTSKLCTIKANDLEELQDAMRVIAPIDGWLYSGQLTRNNSNGVSQYVVKLDGDGSSYLFSAENILNDVIKEVRVKSVSELRKGARICCYWSRQYKCLSTGVVTSRTFEATKSLVSVKYDNGDLSALPLEDLRLLPPDYPKYMSNCDPLGAHGTNAIATNITNNNSNSSNSSNGSNSSNISNISNSSNSSSTSTNSTTLINNNNTSTIADSSNGSNSTTTTLINNNSTTIADDEAATIPPTDETMDFITSVSAMTKDSTMIEAPLNNNTNTSRACENTYCGFEYRPWMFEGPPKRSKRNGRTYRDNYSAIRRGNEVIRIGDSAELIPREKGILPFVAKIDSLYATGRGEMKVRVRWYYRLIETEGEPAELTDGDNALFETDHFDDNDIRSINKTTRILSWTDYKKNHLGHVNNNNLVAPKLYYLAGFYDPVNRIKHLRSDVKEAQ